MSSILWGLGPSKQKLPVAHLEALANEREKQEAAVKRRDERIALVKRRRARESALPTTRSAPPASVIQGSSMLSMLERKNSLKAAQSSKELVRDLADKQKSYVKEFNFMDDLKDGKLSLDELHAGLQKLYDSDLGETFRRDYPANLGINFQSVDEVIHLFKIIDLSREDSISRAEWVRFRTTPRPEILVKLHELNPNNEVTYAAVIADRLSHPAVGDDLKHEMSISGANSISQANVTAKSDNQGDVVAQHATVSKAARGLLKTLGRRPQSFLLQSKEALEEKQLAQAEFDRMDTNKDDVLNLPELQSGLQKVGYSEQEVATLFDELDWNHSQSITREEWVAFKLRKAEQLKQCAGKGSFRVMRRKSSIVSSPASFTPVVTRRASAGSAEIEPPSERIRQSFANAKAGEIDHASEAAGVSREMTASESLLVTNPNMSSGSSFITKSSADAEGTLLEGHMWNELYAALLMADYEQCSRIIGQNRDALLPSINSTDSDQNTLLHMCALSLDQQEAQTVMNPRLVKVVRKLLDMGIEITENSDGTTPAGLFLGKGVSPREVQELFGASHQQQEKPKSFTFAKPTTISNIW